MEYLEKLCNEEDIDFDKLIGLAGRKWYQNSNSDHYNYEKGQMFNEIYEGKNPFSRNELSVEKSSHIKETLELGRQKYKNLRNFVKDHVKLASPDKIRDFQTQLSNFI